MTEVVVQGTLKPDGTLELNQPVGLPRRGAGHRSADGDPIH